MTQETNSFWLDVNSTQAEIVEKVRAGVQEYVDAAVVENGEPIFIWLTSVLNRRVGTTAGAVCAAPIRLGATRIVEGGHRLSTKQEREQHVLDGNARRNGYASEDARLARLRGEATPPIAISLPAEK